MTRDESLELLDSVHSFPCPFTVKAIGKTDDDFVGRILAAVRQALDLEFDPPYTLRETPGGRHVAVTVEPWMSSAECVLDVYDQIRGTEGLVMLM